MECKDDGLILGKQCVIIHIGQTVRMLIMRLQLHQVDYIDETDLDLRHIVTKDGNCCQRFLGRSITAASQYNIRLLTLIVACPIPDTDTLGTMLNSLLHGQPLMAGMLGCNDNVYIVLASDTVIEAGKQTVCIGGKIHTDNICLLVGNMIQETGILMGKSVVVLLPYIGGKDQVQGSDFLSPGKLVTNLQPLCMLSTHGVYNTDECFIGSEEAMTTGKQIAFQPALAHMLGQVGVHNSSVVCQILVLLMIIAVPITLGFLEYLVETVGHGLIRSKDTEVLCILIQFEDITDEAAQLNHILLFNSTGLGYVYRVITEVRQTEVTKKLTTVCMRIRTDSSVSLRRNVTKSLYQTTILIKELFRMIA